jgi:SAM-dependent methyltransferase
VRGNIREFVRVLIETLVLPQPLVEIGALQVEGQLYSADLRPLFAESGYADYIGCDVRPGLGVDRIEDVHQLSFATDSIGTVLMLETLEHVKNPLQAKAEVFRVLQPGGLVVISSCMDFPVHEHPADYLRFPPQGFDLLLERFSPRRVYLQGSPVFPHSLVGIGQKGDQTEAAQATQALARLDSLVHTISGTLTQEISPRLGHDPFRLLGEDLAEEERVHYPENMLHVAYDRLLQKDEEIQRLQNEVNRLLGEREQHTEAGQSE